MRTVYSDRHRAQDGRAELIDGQLLPCFEKPERADLVLAAIRDAGLGPILEPTAHGRDPIERVHSSAFVEFLEHAWDEWTAVHGDIDGLPLCWPTRAFGDRVPEAIDGKLSYYSFDAGTPLTAGTWDAAAAAVDVALTGADLLLAGERAAFALCRPPGHHAGADFYGGYCFLNNAAHRRAGAARRRRRARRRPRRRLPPRQRHAGDLLRPRRRAVRRRCTATRASSTRTSSATPTSAAAARATGFNLNLPLPRGTGLDALVAPRSTTPARRSRLRRRRARRLARRRHLRAATRSRSSRSARPTYPRIGARIAALGRPDAVRAWRAATPSKRSATTWWAC